MKKQKIVFLTFGLAMLALLLVASPSLAASLKNSSAGRGLAGKFGNFRARLPFGKGMAKPAAAGKITAISGSIITITGNKNTIYTVDATNAKITAGFGPKAQAIAISNLTVGEMISVTGTVSGANIAATAISVFDNSGFGRTGEPGEAARAPRVMGKVAAVNGSSFTVQENGRMRGPQATTTPAAVFTVNTNSATVFTKDGQAATLADVTAGDTVAVSGTIDTSAKTVSAASVNIMTKQPASMQWGKAHAAPTSKNKTSLIGKFLNLFKGKKK